MTTELLTILRSVGNTILDIFVLPDTSVTFSVLFWMVLAVVAWMLVILGQNLARIVSSIVRTISFRISLALRNFKTKLVCKLRQLLPRRKSIGTSAVPMIEFDDLDLAVLRSASVQGAGFALSAPELAEQFRMRPAQVQRSLNMLSKNKMLAYVIGSTDGFDNYRLTDSGAAFFAMWERQNTGA